MTVSLRVVVVGDKGVGKSALVAAICKDKAVDVGEEAGKVLSELKAKYKGQEVDIQIAEADEDDDATIATTAGVFLLCFSVMSSESLERVKTHWAPLFRTRAAEVPVVLVGCKIDLSNDCKSESAVSTETGEIAANLIGADYFESSATTEEGVADLWIGMMSAGLHDLAASPKRGKAKRLSVANMALVRSITEEAESEGTGKKAQLKQWIKGANNFITNVVPYPPSYETPTTFLNEVFFFMCQHGPKEVLTWFVQEYHGRLDLSLNRHQGMSCVHLAAFYGQVEILDMFLNSNEQLRTSVDVPDQFTQELRCSDQGIFQEGSARTPIHCAVMNADEASALAAVKCLLAHQANADRTDSNGLNTLHRAVYCGKQSVVGAVLAAGAKVNARDMRARTALFLAAARGFCGIVRQLLDGKADPAAADNTGMTALHWAARYNHQEALNLLIEFKADCATTDKQGRTALTVATQNDALSVIQSLTKVMAEQKLPITWGVTQGNLSSHQNEANKLSCVRVTVPIADTVGIAVGIRWKRDEEGWAGSAVGAVRVAVLGDKDGKPDLGCVLSSGSGTVDPASDQGSTKMYPISNLPLQSTAYWVAFVTENVTTVEKDSRVVGYNRMYVENYSITTAFQASAPTSVRWCKSKATFAVFISAVDQDTAKNPKKMKAAAAATLAAVSLSTVSTKKKSILGSIGAGTAKMKVDAPISNNVIFKGTLAKKGTGLVKTYSDRFFVLTDSSFDYYRTEALHSAYKAPVPAGRAPLKGASVQVEAAKDKTKHAHKFVFSVPSESIKYTLAATDEKTLKSWVTSLESAISKFGK